MAIGSIQIPNNPNSAPSLGTKPSYLWVRGLQNQAAPLLQSHQMVPSDLWVCKHSGGSRRGTATLLYWTNDQKWAFRDGQPREDIHHVPLATLPRPWQHCLVPPCLHPAAKLDCFKQHHPCKTKCQNIAHPQHKVLPIPSSLPKAEGEWLAPAQLRPFQHKLSLFKPSPTWCPGQAGM